jgi:hypothetical protein
MNVVRIEDIPECAICPRCGQPYKVIDLAAKAARLGGKVPEGSFVFRCCGSGELTIEDEVAELRLRDLLLEYHRERNTAD